jgi:hypothetical protein
MLWVMILGGGFVMKISLLAVTCSVFFIGFSEHANSTTLQIAADSPPDWDANATTQTGTVGSVRVEATSTDTVPWNSTFNDDHNLYARAYNGSLAQPDGTVGDAFNNVISNGDDFQVDIKFLDSIEDPIFYVIDIDMVGGRVSFNSGWDSIELSDDAELDGDSVYSISGAFSDPFTLGASFAVQYLGLFEADTIFSFLWDFTQTDTSATGENVAIGIAVFDEIPPPLNPVPLPAGGFLLISGLTALGFGASRRVRAKQT